MSERKELVDYYWAICRLIGCIQRRPCSEASTKLLPRLFDERNAVYDEIRELEQEPSVPDPNASA